MPRGKFRTPCVVCGALAEGSSRCKKHAGEYALQKRRRLDVLHATSDKRDKYKGDYGKRAKAVKQYAIENNLNCPLCGYPLATGGAIHADHVDPTLGDQSPLQAVHGVCNLRKSNRKIDK